MKLLVVLCLVAVAVAAPPNYSNEYSQNAEILTYENDNIGTGPYRYAFGQSDGTAQQQEGELRNAGLENESIAVKGIYSWIAPNGVRYTVIYTADDEGYKSEIEEEPPGGAPPALVASLLG